MAAPELDVDNQAAPEATSETAEAFAPNDSTVLSPADATPGPACSTETVLP